MSKEPAPTTKTATTTVKAVEVQEPTKDSFEYGGKLYVIRPCAEGDTILSLKGEPGEAPHAIHTRWGDDGMPDPKSEILWAAGDGYVAPVEES